MIFKNTDDAFSSLPNEILYHILSLMPTKYVVRTSILSKSWRYRWALVTNLDFDYTHTINGSFRFTRFVDRVLKLCKTSQVQLFRLHLSKLWATDIVSDWINEAVRLNVCELDIQAVQSKLPLRMLTCKTLTKLRLRMSDKSVYHMWDEFTCQVKLPCMKTLDMTFYDNSLVNAFKLIKGCPILESLSWKVIGYQMDEEDYTFNIPTLKRLKLAFQNCAYNKVVLHVPNLEYLFVGGMLSSVYVMKDVSSLVEASVSFCEIRYDHLLAKLLKGLRI
ncbi:F-box/LRR-repeat protein At4g14103-like [Bidens hawaiensis]|uniref:F-box/LRR-repeat protein At4g14103-like n=1 Tax=Bidens hawaiensis TaxID=980011 RepID=UPI00404A2CC2